MHCLGASMSASYLLLRITASPCKMLYARFHPKGTRNKRQQAMHYCPVVQVAQYRMTWTTLYLRTIVLQTTMQILHTQCLIRPNYVSSSLAKDQTAVPHYHMHFIHPLHPTEASIT
jgi:hypothetical protein